MRWLPGRSRWTLGTSCCIFIGRERVYGVSRQWPISRGVCRPLHQRTQRSNRNLVDLLAVGAMGLVHLTGAGGVSRADFARAILDEARRFDVEIEPVLSDSMAQRARRPADSRLDTSLFSRLTGAPPRPWLEGLREALALRRQESAGL